MSKPPHQAQSQDVTGLTPAQWRDRLERAAQDEGALAQVLRQLDQEMNQERAWLHDNPSPGRALRAVLRVLGGSEQWNIQQLAGQLKAELQQERALERRYRLWLPDEDRVARLLPYLSQFEGQVRPDDGGLQVVGFRKYKGLHLAPHAEAFVFYLSERFSRREPANFHLSYDASTGCLGIERAFKRELPSIPGVRAIGRAVLCEMARGIVPELDALRAIRIDNATNAATREALVLRLEEGGSVRFRVRRSADADATPLGHLMRKLAADLGLTTGRFRLQLRAYGVLRISLEVLGIRSSPTPPRTAPC